MNIFLLVVGSILCAIAIFLLFKYHALKSDIRAMNATETSAIADLRAMQSSIAREMGRAGTWREQVEVNGIVTCSRPLKAELSEIPCVYYHALIEEEYERTDYDTDSDGDTHIREVRGTKTISKNQNRVNFYLEDESDKIFVNLAGAEIDALTVVNGFESCYDEIHDDYRILGYQHTEKIIELDSEVYILGEVKDTDGRLQIGALGDRQKPFIISYKSEEELLHSKKSQGQQRLFWGIGLLTVGCIVVTLALLGILVWS
ncbi:MAG: E3 ubiquitin ligase family protein [Cyanobacteria bacterium J06588_4]